MRRWLTALALLAMPVSVPAQTTVPVHNNMVILGTGTGAQTILPSRQRSLLVLTNGSDTTILCTLDGTDASATSGISIPAAGQVIFETRVPRGALKCYAGSNGKTLQYMEGQ